jgi:two-component system, LytTR family, response regulator
MIRALIIDDEYLAREELAQLLARTKRFQLVGCCGNALEAIKMIQRENPDVLFLDIEMPVVDGFELLGMIDQERMPQVVFVTAFDQHALRAFEEKTLDYLVKPVDPDRLQKTLAKLDKALSRGTQPNYPIPPLNRIPCQIANRVKLIPPEEIYCVESNLSGIRIVTAEGSFSTELTLRVLEQKTSLVRCQKQHLVNPAKVDELIALANGQGELRLRGGHNVPVSRRYMKSLKGHLGLSPTEV